VSHWSVNAFMLVSVVASTSPPPPPSRSCSLALSFFIPADPLSHPRNREGGREGGREGESTARISLHLATPNPKHRKPPNPKPRPPTTATSNSSPQTTKTPNFKPLTPNPNREMRHVCGVGGQADGAAPGGGAKPPRGGREAYRAGCRCSYHRFPVQARRLSTLNPQPSTLNTRHRALNPRD
jgi:hypothetical protein